MFYNYDLPCKSILGRKSLKIQIFCFKQNKNFSTWRNQNKQKILEKTIQAVLLESSKTKYVGHL